MATIRDVASNAGVSLATASRVLGSPAGRFPVSVDTAQRVREAAERLGYRVNYHMQAVATGRANAIGFCAEVVMERTHGYGAGSLYFDALRGGVESTAQDAAAALVSIHPFGGKSALTRGIEFLRERRLDVLVVPGSSYVSRVVHEFERDAGLPLVMVNALVPVRRPSVVFDTSAAMRLVLEHVAELGHRHLLWLGPVAPERAAAVERADQLMSAAWERGLTGEALRMPVEDLGVSVMPDALRERITATFAQFLNGNRPAWTAIVAYNDHYAAAACEVLSAANLRVPEDISVVGFDNLVASFCVPALTTVDHCLFEMGRRAGELAAEVVAANATERQAMRDRIEIVAPRLVVRKSTGPARR